MPIGKIDREVAETSVMILSILKSMSTKHGKQKMPVEVGWDTVHELFYDAIFTSADKVTSRYFEGDETEIVRITDENMTNYFKKAYIYGRLKNLPEDKNENPYLTNARQNLSCTLGAIESYSYDCWLKVNERSKPRLYLFHYPEYYPNAEVIYQLYRFFDFFQKTLPLLESELRQIRKSKQKTMSIKTNKKRRKAA